MTSSQYRALPSVERLVAEPQLAALVAAYGHPRVVDQVREVLEEARKAIASGDPPPALEVLVTDIVARAQSHWRSSLTRVINATGIIIHTNLGRAPLSQEAIQAMAAVSMGYSNLEYDLEEGERGSRHAHVEALLTQLTGAEAALVVNNNAAAVLLGLTALAQGKEVVVSRGQAVEIGGGFRIPDVLRQSGARLVEVGTTNRTYIQDYDNALSHETAALLRVHSSNFRVIGFTHGVDLGELVELAHRRGLIVLDDLGSGCLLDTTAYGLAQEPLVQESIAAGADVVFYSGDKLLGGPQAGIVVGRKALVDRLKAHPLARAVRIDKASLAGLAATLVHYLRNEALEKVPVWRMIAASPQELAQRAARWADRIGTPSEVVEGLSMVGGGSLPGESLPSWLLALPQSGLRGGQTVPSLAAALRQADSPIVARIEHEQLLLDPRTVLPEEEEALLQTLAQVIGK